MAEGQILQIAESSIGTGRCELQLEGELDLWSAERLQAVLQRASRDHEAVVVGLERCEFVDSTGIALFLQIHRQLEGEGGRLVLYGCSDQVLRVFTVAGLTEAGLVFDSRGEAIAELASVGKHPVLLAQPGAPEREEADRQRRAGPVDAEDDGGEARQAGEDGADQRRHQR
jgi:anti-sigma B factor antagonist